MQKTIIKCTIFKVQKFNSIVVISLGNASGIVLTQLKKRKSPQTESVCRRAGKKIKRPTLIFFK